MSSKFFKKNKPSKIKFKAKTKVITLNSQLERLMASFPMLKVIESTNTKFEVVLKLRPDVFSKEYHVKIIYEIGKVVSVFIINEELKIAKNRTKLPHVWDNDKQKICLYSSDGGKWNSGNSIVSTIIPWASEWLYYYEMWLIDGIWHGGGHNEYSNENEIKNEQE